MSAASGWDRVQAPASGVARQPLDRTGEPVGYNPVALPTYEQPPRSYGPPPRIPVSEAQAGYRMGLVGLLTSFLIIGGGIGLAGMVVSTVGLIKVRHVAGKERRKAVAGIVLGAVALIVCILVYMGYVLPGETP